MMHKRGGLPIDAFPSEEILEEDFILYFRTNTLGPIHTMNAFLPLLRKGQQKKYIVISTPAGSLEFASQPSMPEFVGYGISKAAVNLAVAKFAGRFKGEGIIFLAMSPGMVKTLPGPDKEVDKIFQPYVRCGRYGRRTRVSKDLLLWNDLSETCSRLSTRSRQ